MPVTMTKAALGKVLTEERLKMRLKQRQSVFLRRTLSIYNGQKKRFFEYEGRSDPSDPDEKHELPYTLEQFREKAQAALKEGRCCYCHETLTLKKMTADHVLAIVAGGGWELDNLCFPCQSCNWQKGRMDGTEFRRLLGFCKKYLSAASAADVKRRLSIGGKWSPK